MIKIRLLKTKYNDYSQLLDSASVPDIENLDDLNIIANTIGTLLKPYAESLTDPNIVSVLLDKSIKKWTVSDIESIQLSLSNQKFDVLVTAETGEDLDFTPAQVKYIMVDRSTMLLGAIPYGYTRVKDKKDAVDSIAVLDVLKSILSEFDYFDKKKFVANPIEDCLDQLFESRKLLGTINSYAMTRLSNIIAKLNKKLYVISMS